MKRAPRHLLVAASAWIARAITMALGIATIRLLTNRLTADGYAAYVLLANLVPWFSLADVGMGSCLQNEVSAAATREESDEPIIAAATLVAVGVTLSVILASVLGAGFIGPRYIGRFAADGARHFAVGALLVGLGCIGTYAQRIWYARQQGHIASIATVVGSAGGAAALFTMSDHPDISTALICGLGPAAAVGVCNLVFLLPRTAAPYREAIQGDLVPRLLRQSGQFFALGLMATFVLNFDYITMSRLLSSDDALEYSMCARIFELLNVLYSALLLAYWPRAAADLALGRIASVRRTARSYVYVAAASLLVAGVVLFLLRERIVDVLAPARGATLTFGMIASMTVLAIAKVWTNTAAIIVQARGRVRVLLLVTPAQAVANVSLMSLLVPKLGGIGIPLATAISYLLTAAWVLPLYVRRIESTLVEPVPEGSVES